MSGAAMFTLSQTAYRWYEDGSEGGSADAGVAQSTALTRYLDGNQNLGLRIRLQESGGAAGATTDDYQLQYSKNGGAFTNVTTSSSNVKGVNSTNLTDAGTTTNRLGAGSGSFVAGEISEDGLVDDRQITASNYTELLYSLQLVAADLADNDVLTFRVLLNGATITYSVTPQVTVRVPAAVLSNGIALSSRTNTIVVHKGGSVYEIVKSAGTAATFDADAVSSVGLTGDFVLRLKKLNSGNGSTVYGGGMNVDPTTSTDWTSIDRALFWFEATSQWRIYESGVEIVAALSDATYSWIWRTGTQVGYGRGADLTTAQASPDRTVTDSGTLKFDSAFFYVGDRLEALLYIPITAIAVGRADETDTALSLGKGIGVGRSNETDTAIALGVGVKIGISSEIDSAQALAVVQKRAIGLANETDSAQGLGIKIGVGKSFETDTALSLSALQLRSIGRADEIDTAFALSMPLPIGRADETDIALGLGIGISVGVAEEVDTALRLNVHTAAAVETSSKFISNFLKDLAR